MSNFTYHIRDLNQPPADITMTSPGHDTIGEALGDAVKSLLTLSDEILTTANIEVSAWGEDPDSAAVSFTLDEFRKAVTKQRNMEQDYLANHAA